MAIIYSYQENEELRNSDMLVGTATTLHNGQVRKITKNFTLGQLKTFINTGDLILSNGGTSGPATLIDNVLNIPVYQGAITLTTTGSTGSATLIGNTLNIPVYSGGVVYAFNAPLTEASGTVSISQANTTTNGYLSSTDWNTFYGKQNALSGTGVVKSTAGTISYINGTSAQYIAGDGSLITFPAIPSITPAALTRTNDTNVTLTLGGTPNTALLQGVSLTLGWDGTLADSRIASAATWNAKQNAITLTTTGSGAATFIGSTLNIPTPPAATFTSLTTTGSSGSSTLISGVLNVPTYTLAGLGGITLTSLSSTATGLTYTNTTGVFSLTAGYSIPTTSSQTNWDTAYINRITSLTTTGTGAATLIANVLNIPTPPTATFTSLTTTGSSGSSTLTAGVLNVPTYTLTGLGGVPTSRTLTINGTAYDLTADRSWSVGTVTSVTATSPITSTGGVTPVISTSMATNKLIGRSTAGTGVMEEITVGSGLALLGGTLSSSGSPGSILHGTAAGTDTYTVTIAGAAAYADGDAYLVRFTNGNTTGATLNINGLGATPLYRNNDGAVIGGDIWDGAEMLCIYNSSINAFQCIGTSSNSLFAYVTNADSVAITKGQPVYAFGGTGDRLTVKRAFNTSDAGSARTIGVVLTPSIAVNQKGIIIIEGLLDGLNILPTSTWADGDTVYLGTTAGSITNVKQYAPNHLVYLGTVTTASNGSSGRWYVKVQNGYELDELHNVQAQSPSLKDTLWYDSGVTPGQWKTASIPTILGYTPVTNTRTISTTSPLQGGGDLTADRTLSILQSSSTQNGYLSSADWSMFNGKFTLPSFTSGSVIFSNGTTLAQDNSNFFWDDTNNRLGIGTSSPGVRFVNSGGPFSSGPTLGSAVEGSQALLSNNGLYGMYSGVSSNGDVWHQVQRNDGNAAVYNLALQPNGGNIYIGTNAPIYSPSAKMQFLFNGLVEFGINFKSTAVASIPIHFTSSTGTQTGYIFQDNTGVFLVSVSDYRLKEDLNSFSGLDLISKVNVYDYKWKGQDKRSFGVMAHELQEVIPQAAFGEKDGERMQGVDYSVLVPILIQSIKELEEKIKVLETKITTNK